MTTWREEDQQRVELLVDGELAGERRRETLRWLEGHPQGWRRCALAFVEAQSLRAAVEQRIGTPPVASIHRAAVPQRSPSRSGYWLALAAGLLVSFVAGRGTREEPGRPDAVAVASVDPEPAAAAPEVAAAAGNADAVTLVVRDTAGAQQRVRVPLVDVSTGEQPWDASGPLAGVRRRLVDEGFDLRQRRRYAPLFFERDNRLIPMAVPVEDTYIVPVNRPVY